MDFREHDVQCTFTSLVGRVNLLSRLVPCATHKTRSWFESRGLDDQVKSEVVSCIWSLTYYI